MKYIFYFFLISIMVACSSPKKHFSKGNYEKAYKSALKDLSSGKRDRQLKSILNNSMKELADEAFYGSESLLKSNDIEDWESAFALNEDLIQLYYEGKRYLDNTYENDFEIIESNNDALREDIVGSYLELGDISMEVYNKSNDKRAAQEAYYMYDGALKYIDSNRELREKIENALIAGTIFIDVTVDVWDTQYKYIVEREFRDLEDNDNLFIEVTYDNWSGESDCQLEVDFSSLDIDIRNQSRVERFSEQIEDGFRNEIDSSGNTTRIPILRDIEAEVTIIEERRAYSWDIRVTARSYTNYCDFSDNRFQVSDQVLITDYRTNGDERAVPDSYRNNNRNFSSNDERNLIENLVEDVFNEVERYYF